MSFSPQTTYGELKAEFLTAFPGCELWWVLEKELYGKIQEYNELGLDFILCELELIQTLNLPLSDAAR